jgi:threonine synthase
MSRCLAFFNRTKTKVKTQFLWLLLEILAVLSPADFWRCGSRSNHSLSIRKVSNIQEKQLTTLGQNIKARGGWCFDDCQDMVKKAFLDDSLTSQSDFSKFD